MGLKNSSVIPSAFSAVGIPVQKNVERQVSWLPGYCWLNLLPHLLILKDNGVRGFVPGYSGGTAPVFHRTSLFSSGSPGMMNHRTFRCYAL